MPAVGRLWPSGDDDDDEDDDDDDDDEVRPSVSSMHTTLPPHQLRLIHILPLLRAGFESCFLSLPILTFGPLFVPSEVWIHDLYLYQT